MRTNSHLQRILDVFLNGAFADMPQENQIKIAFGRRAKRRFGSIKMTRDERVSHITINGVFRRKDIPEEIIQATVAHELCHYAHGFSSPLPRKYKHPHQGGVIQRELKKRGLFQLHQFEQQWTKNNWEKVLREEFPQMRPSRRALQRTIRRSRSRQTSLRQVRALIKQISKHLKP